jgi:tetratricopeptide (TPR) repeat protein
MRFLCPLSICLTLSAVLAPLVAAEASAPAGSTPADQPSVAPAPIAPPAPAVAPSPTLSPAAPSTGQTQSADSSEAVSSSSKSDDVDVVKAEIAARAIPKLKELVARQDTLLAALRKGGDDQDNAKRDIQNLIFDYDVFLRTFPGFAPGYVTYGMLLGKVGMRRESTAMLLKANQIDSDIPLVKNQLGNYLAEEGEPIEAANYFISAIRLAPNEPLYHYQLGTLLFEARDSFLKSGQWTREQLDRNMQDAFKHAAELAPGNVAFSYRYAQSFYDLAEPNWDEALKVWGAMEDQSAPGLEKETIRLHAANILIRQKKFDHARVLLGSVTDERLQAQKQKLLDQLPTNAEK